jgi:hypothetical protein
MSSAFRIWASVVSLAVILQVGLASYGAFHAVNVADDKGSIAKKSAEDAFAFHAILGYLIFLAAIVLLVLAFLARRGGVASSRVRWSAILLGLILVQIVFALIGHASAGLGILHGMNALAVAGVAGSLAGREWAQHRAGTSAVATTA